MVFSLINPDNYEIVTATLGQRLPRSGMSYNVLQMVQNNLHPSTVTTKVYAYNRVIQEEIPETLVFIVIVQHREIYNDLAVIISPPKPGNVTSEMKTEFEKLINWDFSICFCAVDSLFSTFVGELCSKNGKLVTMDQCEFMSMSNSRAREIDVLLPSQQGANIEARELSPENAVLVAKRWKFASEGSDKMIAETIQHTGSAGVYVDGELASWVVIFTIGSINALFTEDSYRGKGFGGLTMRKACKIAGEKGLWPNVQIQIGNTASTKLMTKTGFKMSHLVDWVIYEPCSK